MLHSPAFEKLKDEFDARMDEWMLCICGLTQSTHGDVQQAMGRAYNEVAPGQDDLDDIASDLGYHPSQSRSAFWLDFEVYVAEQLSDHARAYSVSFLGNGDDPRFNGDRKVVVRVGGQGGIQLHSIEVDHDHLHSEPA